MQINIYIAVFIVVFLAPPLRCGARNPPNKGEIMNGNVIMLTNNGAITSIRVATSWTDDHDPVVIDIPFATHEVAFQAFNLLTNWFGLEDITVWQDGIAMRETNKRHTRSNHANTILHTPTPSK